MRPFFRDHFARLDRQVVLVDALAAFNAGPEALRDLEAALAGILDCFRIGRGTLLSSLFRPRIDRILFAATKADHLHHSSHDRLEAVLRRTVAKAVDARRICRRRDRRRGAGRGARHPRGPGASAAAKSCPPSSARPPPARRRAARPSTATPKSRPFPAICPTIPKQLFSGRGRVSRPLQRRRRKDRFPLSALSAAAARAPGRGRPGAASHPPRPRAAVPDRRQTAMSERSRIGGRRPSSSTIPA